ncbi:hypothetical protein F4801DRAFT_547888 [Xylaria longipes]|nr:hypothetical protein F4801DRAFT_547888 [Xylaria longipes]
MQHLSKMRRKIIVATIPLLAIVWLTYRYSFGTDNTFVTNPAIANPVIVDPRICQVWLDRGGREYEQPLDEDCDNSILLPQVGDVNVLGTPQRCVRASSRLDQYRSAVGRGWSDIRWGRLQSECSSATYELPPPEYEMEQIWHWPPHQGSESQTKKSAIVLRTWDDYEYTDDKLAWLRALIVEASLERGGRYRVFFLVNVKDPEVHLDNSSSYARVMRKCVPKEFRDMAFLYNERTLKAWYPHVSEHGAQNQMYQALQIFSHKFPEYDYIWQLEMDLRLTGHIYDTLEESVAFARTQKRHNLWERNGRFYNPTLYNNSYENFVQAVDTEIGDTGVWGPVPTLDFVPQGPQPPLRGTKDWGVGEEADLITFMPMIDPVGTEWVYEHDVHHFADKDATPRRLAIVSITRSSRRLLHLVSEAQQQRGQWLVSEATLETFSLLHGLKAVTIPHPIVFTDDVTPTMEELDANIHKGPPSNKAGGERPSMLYTSKGWVDGPWWGASFWFTGNGAQTMWDAYVGGASLPPMLLHPVKDK